MANSYLLAFTVVVLITFNSGRATPSFPRRNLITGNAPYVKPKDHPNVGELKITLLKHGMPLTGNAKCTGTLISPSLVLTAAHCLDLPDGLTIKKVAVHFPTMSQPVNVENFRTHYTYKKHKRFTNFYGDIAILRLEECVTTVKPAKLFTDRDVTCRQGKAVGYGRTDTLGFFHDDDADVDPTTDAAKTTALNIHSPEACEELNYHMYEMALKENRKGLEQYIGQAYEVKGNLQALSEEDFKSVIFGIVDKQQLDSSSFCATPTTKTFQTMHKGDSGGPLFINGKIAGVVNSIGSVNMIAAGFLTQYTSVPHHIRWIQAMERDLNKGYKCKNKSKRRLRAKTTRRKLRADPFLKGTATELWQKNVLKLSRKKVSKFIKFLNNYDQCRKKN